MAKIRTYLYTTILPPAKQSTDSNGYTDQHHSKLTNTLLREMLKSGYKHLNKTRKPRKFISKLLKTPLYENSK